LAERVGEYAKCREWHESGLRLPAYQQPPRDETRLQ